MPIYEYKWSHCEHEIEVIQKISDKPKTTCPKCNTKSLKKLISAPSFRLKGGGWYETDFKSGKKKNVSGSENSSSSTSSSSSSSTSSSNSSSDS